MVERQEHRRPPLPHPRLQHPPPAPPLPPPQPHVPLEEEKRHPRQKHRERHKTHLLHPKFKGMQLLRKTTINTCQD